MRILSKLLLGLLAVLLLSSTGLAATEDTNTNTVSPTLVISATVQKAIRLTLETGSQCPVSPGPPGNYNIDFGTVDALGIVNATCGSKFPPPTPGTNAAIYYTDYKLLPVFTSQSVSTNTITAYVSTNFTMANLSAVQSKTAPGAWSDLTAMSTNSGAQTNVETNATSGTAITRYIGVAVDPANGASLTGSDSATITYTLTVQ
jgi:hypothetical protein